MGSGPHGSTAAQASSFAMLSSALGIIGDTVVDIFETTLDTVDADIIADLTTLELLVLMLVLLPLPLPLLLLLFSVLFSLLLLSKLLQLLLLLLQLLIDVIIDADVDATTVDAIAVCSTATFCV